MEGWPWDTKTTIAYTVSYLFLGLVMAEYSKHWCLKHGTWYGPGDHFINMIVWPVIILAHIILFAAKTYIFVFFGKEGKGS